MSLQTVKIQDLLSCLVTDFSARKLLTINGNDEPNEKPNRSDAKGNEASGSGSGGSDRGNGDGDDEKKELNEFDASMQLNASDELRKKEIRCRVVEGLLTMDPNWSDEKIKQHILYTV